MNRRSPFVHAGHHIGPAKMSRTSLVPRNYQIEAVSVAIAGNTVINMDTGGGKTLIAVIVMDFFLSINNKAVCFVVPTRALVSQQAQYLRDNCKTRNGKPVEVKGMVVIILQEFVLRD